MPKVNLISSAYPKVVQDKAVGTHFKFNIADGKTVAAKWQGIRAESMDANVAGFITNDKDVFVYHIAPEQNTESSVINFLADKIAELKTSGDNLWAYICGGWALENNNKVAEKSFNLYNSIANELEEQEVPFGMMCGKYEHGNMDNFRFFQNKLFVWGDKIKERLVKDEPLTVAKVMDKFADDYQCVEFSPDFEFEVPFKKSLR